MVSLGVIMEFFALGHSIKEGKELEENLGQLESTNLVLRANVAALEVQVSQTSNNVAGMDPRLQPVLDMSATVVFVVTGTNFSNDLTNWDAQRVARMSLWVNEEILFLSNPIEAETFSRSDFNIAGSPKGKIILDLGRQANSRMYGVRFHSFNFLSALRIGFSVAAIDNVNLLKMEFNFLPHDSKIEVGSVDLVVNSCHKMFKIFPQVDTSPSNGIPGFPYLVLATNVSHDAIK